MAIYIRTSGEHVELAGEVADKLMLDNGYVLYKGTIPAENNPNYLKWDGKAVVVNTQLKYDTELSIARKKRDVLLAECDWIVAKYTELQQPIPTEWATYRQALRDITVNFDPEVALTWPVKPTTN